MKGEIMSVRESFVKRFGEDQAVAIELAAESHKNGIHDKTGDDPFKWAILICVGFQCMEIDKYRKSHNITIPFEDIKKWAIEDGDLRSHNGDVDYLCLFAGKYNDWIAEKELID
jgi:hypothetical protein